MIVTKFTKRVVILNCAIPAVLLAWDAANGSLGANPVNFAIRTTGLLTIIFLLISLAVTPAMRLTGWNWLGTFRRTAGVSAFVYAAIHFGLYTGFDRAGNIADTLSEIASRRYLLIGTIGLLIMVPLAATSTDGMIRRLGGKRWKLLHRLAYVAAIAGAIHFLLLVKADITRPIVVISILGVLFAWRLVAHYRQLLRDARLWRSGVRATAAKPRTWNGAMRVARIFDETSNVRTFRLVPPEGGPLPFTHEPGQYLILSLTIEGRAVRRSYTIASPPSRNHFLEITVKREDRGLVSRHLHTMLREGDTVSVTAPAGRFTFGGRESDSILMIAGGVGITPLMAKLRYLTDTGWPGRIHLVVSARTGAERIFEHELDVLQQRHPNVRVSVTLTREESPAWTGRRSRIDAAWLAELISEHPAGRIHLCGPTEMTAPIIHQLTALGVAVDRIREESFASPSRDSSAPATAFNAEAAGQATLEFAGSGRVFDELKGRTILEVAEAQGISLHYDCRAAVCGQCKIRLVSGTVAMDAEDALTAADRSAGLILACQARCQDQVVVELNE